VVQPPKLRVKLNNQAPGDKSSPPKAPPLTLRLGPGKGQQLPQVDGTADLPPSPNASSRTSPGPGSPSGSLQGPRTSSSPVETPWVTPRRSSVGSSPPELGSPGDPGPSVPARTIRIPAAAAAAATAAAFLRPSFGLMPNLSDLAALPLTPEYYQEAFAWRVSEEIPHGRERHQADPASGCWPCRTAQCTAVIPQVDGANDPMDAKEQLSRVLNCFGSGGPLGGGPRPGVQGGAAALGTFPLGVPPQGPPPAVAAAQHDGAADKGAAPVQPAGSGPTEITSVGPQVLPTGPRVPRAGPEVPPAGPQIPLGPQHSEVEGARAEPAGGLEQGAVSDRISPDVGTGSPRRSGSPDSGVPGDPVPRVPSGEPFSNAAHSGGGERKPSPGQAVGESPEGPGGSPASRGGEPSEGAQPLLEVRGTSPPSSERLDSPGTGLDRGVFGVPHDGKPSGDGAQPLAEVGGTNAQSTEPLHPPATNLVSQEARGIPEGRSPPTEAPAWPGPSGNRERKPSAAREAAAEPQRTEVPGRLPLKEETASGVSGMEAAGEGGKAGQRLGMGPGGEGGGFSAGEREGVVALSHGLRRLLGTAEGRRAVPPNIVDPEVRRRSSLPSPLGGPTRVWFGNL
jgi:hypothetical protein